MILADIFTLLSTLLIFIVGRWFIFKSNRNQVWKICVLAELVYIIKDLITIKALLGNLGIFFVIIPAFLTVPMLLSVYFDFNQENYQDCSEEKTEEKKLLSVYETWFVVSTIIHFLFEVIILLLCA